MKDDLGLTGELLQAAQRGDRDALERLFARYLPRVLRMVALRVGQPVDELPPEADDIVQETLMRAFLGLGSFELRTEGSFRHYLAQVALNKVRDAARKHGTGKARATMQRYEDLDLSESVLDGNVPTPSQEAAGRELNARIEHAMLELPAKYREVITLKDIAGMSYGEVAAELGLSADNCRKIVQRAKQMVREKLGKSEPERGREST